MYIFLQKRHKYSEQIIKQYWYCFVLWYAL